MAICAAGTLEVHLERASDLQIGTFRIGSPYVVVFCGQSQQVTSRTAEGGTTPVFNETHKFRVDETTPELLIWMYNKRTFKEPDELGWIRIPLANLFQGSGITKLPSSSFALTSRSSGRHSGNLTLTLKHTPHSFQQQGPSQTSYEAQHAQSSQGAFSPSFRSNQGRRPEAELREIATHAVEIPALDWVKLYAKLELSDTIRLEELISAEDSKKVEEEAAKILPAELEKLVTELATQNPGDLDRLKAAMKYAEAKKRPAAAPKASYVPSFRSEQGRRPEAELVEIAANRFNIRPLDWVRLMAKLEFEDVRRLEYELISPEDVAEMEEMQGSLVTPQEMQQLMKELTPGDMARLQALLEYSQRIKNAQAHTQLAAQRAQIDMLQGATQNAEAAARNARRLQNHANYMGGDYDVEYRITPAAAPITGDC